jgi:hypothetical protein
VRLNFGPRVALSALGVSVAISSCASAPPLATPAHSVSAPGAPGSTQSSTPPAALPTDVSVQFTGTQINSAKIFHLHQRWVANATFVNQATQPVLWSYNLILVHGEAPSFAPAQATTDQSVPGTVWAQNANGVGLGQLELASQSQRSVTLECPFTDATGRPLTLGLYSMIFLAHLIPPGGQGNVTIQRIQLAG